MPKPTNDAARAEAAILLGVDIDHLSAADGLRVDMVSALRLVIDSEQATVLSGNSADLAKLNIAVQSLIALLPGKALPEPAPAEGGKDDPREIMLQTYLEMRRRGEFADPLSTREGCLAEVERLRARVAELEAGAPEDRSTATTHPVPSGAAPAGDAPPPAAPPAPSNVVPLSRTPAAPAAPPVPQPPRACRVGETWSPERGFQPIPPKPNDPPAAAASTPRAAAPAPSFDYDEAMRYVLPDGSISPTPGVGGGSKFWGPV
jgi:hypothetical protein